jgi:hypothetical protein
MNMAPQIWQYWPVFVAATLFEAFAERGKKRFPHALGNGTAVCHSVCLVHKTTVSTVAFNNERFHSISMLIAKVTFCRWIVHVGQHMHFLFVLEIIAVKSHLVLAIMSPHFNFSILWSMLPGIPLLFGVSLNSFIVCQVINQFGGMRKSCPCPSVHCIFCLFRNTS